MDHPLHKRKSTRRDGGRKRPYGPPRPDTVARRSTAIVCGSCAHRRVCGLAAALGEHSRGNVSERGSDASAMF